MKKYIQRQVRKRINDKHNFFKMTNLILKECHIYKENQYCSHYWWYVNRIQKELQTSKMIREIST